jgi:hypothetical protein
MTVHLQMVKKIQNERSVQILQRHITGSLAQPLMGKAQQESETIAISGHGTCGDVLLLHQALHEEPLQQGWKALRHGSAHETPPGEREKRWAAIASSSGVAVTYQ